MKVQLKILLLLLLIVATFISALVALRISEKRKFRSIAEQRAEERNQIFDEFLRERGDSLNVFTDDSTVWDALVRAIVKGDSGWFEQQFGDAALATYGANALWIYRADRTLFYSINNRFADVLRELPVPPEAFEKIFAHQRTAHFYLKVPLGWMEVRGATIHPSRDRFRETTPQGYFFAGSIWIDYNISKMSRFTGYSIRIVPVEKVTVIPPSAEEQGLITFSRLLPGWDGKPIARIHVANDSPIVRELNRASHRLFIWLIVFAAILFLVLSTSLIRWVRRPLRLISRNLEQENPAGLERLSGERTEFGRLAQLILNFRHTEERLHKAEEELRHSQKLEAVGRLAGGVAHDFNNLLTAIIGYSELLEERLREDGASREQAQLIRKAGEQAASLTRQLLAFSRKQLLQPKVLDLNRLVMDMEKLLQRVIGEHIHIALRLEATDPRVRADPNQLEQVVLNLGINARDAMPRGGTLTLTTRNVTRTAAPTGDGLPAGHYVSLSVSDTGLGMDTDTKSRIFEPFFTTKGPGKGTGLGLATVYGIIKQSHGAISVESELGEGSQFRIDLPHVDALIEPPKVEPPEAEKAVHAETVLVVEDEEVVRTLVCTVLEEAGYKILFADSPSEAIRLVASHDGQIDLLVTDVVMPEMHGPVLGRELALLRPGMRVLYVSGYSESDISDQGVIDPDLEVLQKPFTHRALVRKVRELLDAKPARLPTVSGLS